MEHSASTLLTVDMVVTQRATNIVLIQRKHEPFLDRWVLPGGHVELKDSSVASAGLRELAEEVNLHVHPQCLEFLCVLDRLGRDPRPDGRRISLVYWVDLDQSADEVQRLLKAGDDADDVGLLNLQKLQERHIGFDHWTAIEIVRARIFCSSTTDLVSIPRGVAT
jgi:8-oxo-dGTP diphosphatase